jgi:hypothetical protein
MQAMSRRGMIPGVKPRPSWKSISMTRVRIGLLPVVILLALSLTPAATQAADVAPPLVDLSFAGSLHNAGSLGGEPTITTHVPAEAAAFEDWRLGGCLDLTAASRHGGAAGVDTSPAGSSLVFKNEKLAGLEAFSVLVWSRQEPGVEGVNARLTWADRGWDLTPARRGFSVSIALSGSMTPFFFVPRFSFRDRVGFPAADEWRLTAFTVGSGTVRGFEGGLHRPPALLGEQPYSGNPSSGSGTVTIGNLAHSRAGSGGFGSMTGRCLPPRSPRSTKPISRPRRSFPCRRRGLSLRGRSSSNARRSRSPPAGNGRMPSPPCSHSTPPTACGCMAPRASS